MVELVEVTLVVDDVTVVEISAELDAVTVVIQLFVTVEVQLVVADEVKLVVTVEVQLVVTVEVKLVVTVEVQLVVTVEVQLVVTVEVALKPAMAGVAAVDDWEVVVTAVIAAPVASLTSAVGGVVCEKRPPENSSSVKFWL